MPRMKWIAVQKWLAIAEKIQVKFLAQNTLHAMNGVTEFIVKNSQSASALKPEVLSLVLCLAAKLSQFGRVFSSQGHQSKFKELASQFKSCVPLILCCVSRTGANGVTSVA